jgi:hypothetical protein
VLEYSGGSEESHCLSPSSPLTSQAQNGQKKLVSTQLTNYIYLKDDEKKQIISK